MLGRQQLLAQLLELLAAPERLISLVGPGGIGKTRLARAVLDQIGGRFVDLSDCSDLDDVMASLATSLGGTRSSDDARTTRQLAVALQDLHGPAVLDNAEHLLDDITALVRELLAAGAPQLVVTSRVPLGLPRERVVRVGPLAREHGRTLFLRRADPDMVDPERDQAVLDDLIDALGGNPLALELAAGRTPLQGLARIRAALDEGDPLDDLEGQQPARHASLDALVRSSWVLLDEPDRQTLSALGLFRGRSRFEDLVELGLPAPSIRRLQLASLLHREFVDGDVWLGLLDEVRRWVRRHAPAPLAARRRHDAWAAGRARDLAERFHRVDAAPHRRALGRLVPELAAGLDRAEPDTEPAVLGGLLRGLLTWRAEYDQPGMVRLVEPVQEHAPGLEPLDRAWALGRIAAHLRRQGRAAEGLAILEQALDEPDLRAVPAACHLLVVRHANACLYAGRSTQARDRLQTLLPTLEAHAEPTLLADALRVLGTARRVLGEREGALEALSASLHVGRRAGLATQPTMALAQLAMTTRDAQEAAALVDEARARIRTVGPHDAAEWMLLSCLITQQLDTGAVEEAVQTAEQLQALARRRGDIESTVHVRARLAAATLTLHPLEQAEETLGRRLAEQTRLEVRRGEPWVRLGLGLVAHLRDQLELARFQYEQAWRSADELGERLPMQHARVLRAVLHAQGGAAEEDTGRPGADLEHDGAVALIGWLQGQRSTEELAVWLERGGARSVLDRWLRALGTHLLAHRPGWTIAEDGSTVVPPSGEEAIDLSRKGPARRVLARLLDERVDAPGTSVSAGELIEAGWPGERILPDAARARLYAVVRDLRKHGLESLIQTVDGGYRLDPDQDVASQSQDWHS